MVSIGSLLPPLAVNCGILSGILVGFPVVLPDIASEQSTITAKEWAFDQSVKL